MIAAGKSALSMVCSITGGILNIVLDYVFISILDMKCYTNVVTGVANKI